MMEFKNETCWFRLQEEPLPVALLTDFLQTAKAGGIDVFIGTTRQWTGEQETTALSYECYEGMALNVMKALAKEAEAQWPILKVALWHRLGPVPIAEASVIIGVATPHRAEAFTACRFLIDRLKQDVPIWKREHYADGTTEWVQGAGSGGSIQT